MKHLKTRNCPCKPRIVRTDESTGKLYPGGRAIVMHR